MASAGGFRFLGRREVQRWLPIGECIDAVEEAFRAEAEGRTIPPGVLGARVEGGGFHLKAAGLLGDPPYFAAKLNGNFHSNAERFGLPRIQGVVVLADARNGVPLAVIESGELTARRTAAATAVAARHLAPAGAASATLCGCGLQGRAQLEALRQVRKLRTVYLHDADPEAAARLARELAGELEVEILEAGDLRRGTRASAIVVTCTPATGPLLMADDVSAGTLVAAVGADSEEKQELDPELLRRALVVVDHVEQCATIGELHHAIAAGVLARADVHARLSDVVAGLRPGRRRAEEIFVFDSTGVALEDVAAAALVYERAVSAAAGVVLDLGTER